MSQVIRIPQPLYTKLESHAQGFDTPANVIERLLLFYEENKSKLNKSEPQIEDQDIEPASRLEIIYEPADIDLFKRRLIENKQARVELHKTDGSKETKIWHAEKITPNSDLNGNLRSGYLRNWRNKGIEKAVISIQK